MKEAYILWYSYLIILPRHTRHNIGNRIDELFLDLIELSLKVSFARQEDKKIILGQISQKFDCLKYFLTLLWDLKAWDAKKYTEMSKKIYPIGKMIGGWIKKLNS